MSTHEKETFLQTYAWAKDWSELPWSHEEPTLFLSEICRLRGPGKALDIGCGAGTDSLYLAGQGWEVTSLDFMAKALEYTQSRAAEAGVTVNPVEADITTWEPTDEFDVVLDHGLLHNMDPVRYPAYRERVLQALAKDGEFVLLHWHPLFPGQENGKMGPTRVSRDAIKKFFAPELTERYFAREEFDDLPDMVGGGMSQAYYWFRRSPANLDPAGLIEQIKKTLDRHGVEVLTDTKVADELLSRVIGPGRLGLLYRRPEPDEVTEVVNQFADRADVGAAELANLLAVFAAEQHGNICTANPKCHECEVTYCKRLRNR
jgi:SAM-dependent methyltransferase